MMSEIAHIEEKRQFEMAGLDIHGQAPNVDVESRYELYKTFEIDFENSPSKSCFSSVIVGLRLRLTD